MRWLFRKLRLAGLQGSAHGKLLKGEYRQALIKIDTALDGGLEMPFLASALKTKAQAHAGLGGYAEAARTLERAFASIKEYPEMFEDSKSLEWVGHMERLHARCLANTTTRGT